MQNQKIEISAKTIIFTIAVILFLGFLWTIREIIFSLFIAFIIMSALKPPVTFLQKLKAPRFLAALVVYLIFLISFFYLLSVILPPLVNESALLIRALPSIIQAVAPNIEDIINLNSLFQFAPNIANQFFEIIKGIFSNAVFFVSTFFFGFYFILEEDVMRKLLTRFFDGERAGQAITIFDRAERRLNSWFWGEIVLMTVVGMMTFIGLNLIGMRYALALSVLAGLLEVVPTIGPIISAIPAVLLGLSHSYFMGFAAGAIYFIVQQLENNLIVPVIMKKAIGLNPIITLFALLVGGKIGGVLGILLAIPITVFLETAFLEIVKSRPSAENPR